MASHPNQENAPRAFLDSPPATLKTCIYPPCSQSFEPRRSWQNYCCNEHRRKHDALIQKENRQIAKERIAARFKGAKHA